MGTNTNIYLPADVEPKRVHEVMAKCLGVRFNVETFTEHRFRGREIVPSIVVGEPASKSNPWHMRMAKEEKNDNCMEQPDSAEGDYLRLKLRDPVGTHYHTLLFMSLNDSFEYEFEPGGKLLNPSSCVMWAALGKRLVDFFGGNMMYADSANEDDPKNWYKVKKGKFWQRSIRTCADDRWYAYHNALYNEPILTPKEIAAMRNRGLYEDGRGIAFEAHIQKVLTHDKLQQELPLNSTALLDQPKAARKRKI